MYTGRQKKPMPGTCLNCHASTYSIYKKLGNGDIMEGFAKMNQLPYFEAAKHVTHPVSCIDCHDPETLQLRITRPAFIEGIRAYKAAIEGVENYDVNTTASRTGPTRRPGLPPSKPSTRNLSCGARGYTPGRAYHVPTAICPTSALVPSRSVTTT